MALIKKITAERLHLRVPIAVYRKLQAQAKSERRSAHNLALVLIEKGLEAK
jgi:hypothetical protein